MKQKLDFIFLLPSLIILGLLGIPILTLLMQASQSEFFQAIGSETAISALKLSLFTSLISVALTIAFGTPLAYLLAHWQFKGKNLLQLIVDLPVVLPPSVAGLALLLAFGRKGVFSPVLNMFGISLPFSTAAVILAQAFVSAPLYIRSARSGFSEVDTQLVEAARVAGASEWQMFRFVYIPLAGHSLLSGIILAWTRALGEFGATILFAGNLPGSTQTMPLAIYLGLEQSLQVAVALSALLILISVGLLLILRALDKSLRNQLPAD